MTPAGGDSVQKFRNLVDWVEGRLDPATAAEVSEAVQAEDAESAAAVNWIRAFLDLARSMPLQQPPPIVGQHLRRYFTRWSQARAALDQVELELEASLLFDSRLDLAPVGVRGADVFEDVVHLAYTTERADLVIDVSRTANHTVRLDGQVLLTDADQAPIFEAVARSPSGSTRSVDGDALGHFCLVDVPEDVAELRVTNGDVAIVVPLDLRNEDPVW